MKKQLKYLKEILVENKEDLQYLFTVGLPTGVFLILLSQCVSFSEVY